MSEDFTYRSALKHHHVAAFDFIMAQLDLGITYCELAGLSEDTETIRRNAVHARKLFDSATRHRQQIEFTKRENREVLRKSALLKSLMSQITQRLYSLAASEPAGASV